MTEFANELLKQRAYDYAKRLMRNKSLNDAENYIHNDIEKYEPDEETAEGLNHIAICRLGMEYLSRFGGENDQ